MTFPMPVMEPCYMCELATLAAGWNVIERTDLTLTALNGRQFETGQCFVLPRRHAPTLLDLTDAEGAAVMSAARRIAGILVDEFAPDGVLLYQNNGALVGQEVPHFHLHVVPRRVTSNWGPPQLSPVERALRGAHADHTQITDEKRATAAQLLRRLSDR